MPVAPPSRNCGDWTTLKGVSDYGRALFSENVEANVVEFFKWGMLGVGAFFNVTIPTSGAYGGDFSRLRCSEDPNYPQGCVWEGARSDWVWESGVQYSTQPIAISGVYVNGAFYANGATLPSGGSFHVNYPLGRVVLDNPIPVNNVVRAEYSFRSWQFSTGSVPWFRQLQYESLRVDDSQFLQYGSGAWGVLAQNRVQLPAVVVEAPLDRTFTPYGLGYGTRFNQRVCFHVFAEQPYELKAMHDIVTYQLNKKLLLFDKNLMASANQFPLGPDGSIASGARCYPDLVAPTGVGGFGWNSGTFLDMRSEDQGASPPLYTGLVRAVFQVDVGNV